MKNGQHNPLLPNEKTALQTPKPMLTTLQHLTKPSKLSVRPWYAPYLRGEFKTALQTPKTKNSPLPKQRGVKLMD
jgi:hypothetical protein